MNKRELKRFSTVLSREAIIYGDEPFTLRSGGESQWLIDHSRGLSIGRLSSRAAKLLVRKAKEERIVFDVVAGGGVCGRGLAIVTAMEAGAEMAMANLDVNDIHDLGNGYGLHGADVDGATVLVVDDTGTTGGSLLELIEMVRSSGGMVESAICISDRSSGRVATALAEVGVAFHALLEFNEEAGRLQPMTA